MTIFIIILLYILSVIFNYKIILFISNFFGGIDREEKKTFVLLCLLSVIFTVSILIFLFFVLLVKISECIPLEWEYNIRRLFDYIANKLVKILEIIPPKFKKRR